MTRLGQLGSGLRAEFQSDPLLTLAVAAALFAMATTPIAFAVLARSEWFDARRGRTVRRPAFLPVGCAMAMVMLIPAIFTLLALKSRSYDQSRYEFDPNVTLSVLSQGRQYRTLTEADAAVKAQQKYLDQKENDLLDALKRLDESLLALRSAARQHPATYEALPGVLDRLADLHKAVGLDAPQQLLDETAPPAAIAASGSAAPAYLPAPAVVAGNAGAPGGSGQGISTAELDAEIAGVPPAQQTVARFLPLDDVPAGWVAPRIGERHLETFHADNLFEKINGRAESFIQYDVVGMAYCYFHPIGDETSEAQVYIFEMASPLKAFGKYGAEKPEEVQDVAIGTAGYTTAGSAFFYLDKYYVQIVSTSDDAKLSAFALDIARRIAARMVPGKIKAAEGTPEPAAVAAAEMPKEATPELLFKLLPTGPGRSGEKYVAKDVFGYSFFTEIFLADYGEGDATWQGFIRPYASPEEAKAILEKYQTEVKDFGAVVEPLTVEGADQALKSTLDGLTDVILLKGNTIAGANGSTVLAPAEAFARAFARTLPPAVPPLPASEGGSGDGDGS